MARDAGAASDHVIPQADFELDRLTMVILLEGPRAGEYPREEAQRLANEHLHYTVGLVAGGHLLHAGPIMDPGPGSAFTGLAFGRTSPEDLRPLIEKDPAVIAGLETFRLVTHAFPKGSLSFPGATAPEPPATG